MTPIELTKTEFIQRVGNFEESPKDSDNMVAL